MSASCGAMSWRATHATPEGLRVDPRGGRGASARGVGLVVRAGRSRSKKSASPIARKKGRKPKGEGGAAVHTAPPPPKHPLAGPMVEDAPKQTLAEILAQ